MRPGDADGYGYGVLVRRGDGSTFLASGGRGILPFVSASRGDAVKFRKELNKHGMTCRVVPVAYGISWDERGGRKGVRWFHGKSK